MNNEYYGAPTTGSEDFLAHYGVRGMKWGVRKARATGNVKRLGKQFAKAEKKLAKFEKRAASGKKYAKRAAALGAGAAVAGGLAVAGTGKIGGALKNAGNAMAKSSGEAAKYMMKNRVGGGKTQRLRIKGALALEKAGGAISKAGGAMDKWGRGNELGKGLGEAGVKAANAVHKTGLANPGLAALKTRANLRNVSNDTIARIGAGAVGAGLAGAAGYNAYRAATTKRAAKKAAAFKKEMNKAFAGTKYAGKAGTTTMAGEKKKRKK